MHEIICPHCGKAFKIDEAGYADILKQVRDSEFEQQLHERLELAEQDKRNAVELAKTKVASELQKAAAAKDAEIQELKAKLDAGEVARKLAVTEALSAVEKERDALANERARASRGEARTNCRRPRKDAEIQAEGRSTHRGCAEARDHRGSQCGREGARRTEERPRASGA